MARSQKLGTASATPARSALAIFSLTIIFAPAPASAHPPPPPPVALTQLVQRAGCASKIGQGDLKRILSRLPEVRDPNILVGTAAGDDAGVYRLDEHTALVQTVDVFAPIVDDPFLFGQIAAANSVSDVYAMGGRPLTALSIVGFPIEEIDGSIMQAILGRRHREAERGRLRAARRPFDQRPRNQVRLSRSPG